MSLSNKFNSILFNLAGAAVLLTVVGYAGYEAVTTPAFERCTARFPSGQQFALNGLRGTPLSPIELQGRAGSREWGLLKNAQVINNAAGRPGGSLEVTLASTDDEEKVTQNGVGFVWPVPELGKATSACLSYSVFVPAGFLFSAQGHLPGLYGATDLAQIDEELPQDGFATRMSWAQAGFAGVAITANGGGYFNGPDRAVVWPTGRWVDIEQEVKLNSPARDNGELRIWMNGKLILNQDRVKLRKTANTGLSGVVADVAYDRAIGDPVKILVSPFMLQWQ
jgi:hypothetical protein